MKDTVSSATGRRYPLTMICAVFRVPRSTVYQTTAPAPAAPRVVAKREPQTSHSDAEFVEAIRAVLAATPFHGEGYRKVRARLAHRGLALGGKRVLRLMRVHHLLAPRRLGPPNGDPACQRPPYSEPPGSGKLSHPGSPMLSQVGVTHTEPPRVGHREPPGGA
jgi:putative transposase